MNAECKQSYYLNNRGDRWIIPGYRAWLDVPQDGYSKLRKVKRFESFGNFAVFVFAYRGKEISGFPSDTDQRDGFPIVTIKK